MLFTWKWAGGLFGQDPRASQGPLEEEQPLSGPALGIWGAPVRCGALSGAEVASGTRYLPSTSGQPPSKTQFSVCTQGLASRAG